MSDTKLRDLERRWRETGTVEDETTYLLERVRVGDLSREMLELAAHCDHSPAKVVLGGFGREVHGLTAWISGLRGWGKAVCVRAAVVASELSHPVWEQIRPTLGDERHLRANEAAKDWLLCPCSTHVRAAGIAADELPDHEMRGLSRTGLDLQACSAVMGAARLASLEPFPPHTRFMTSILMASFTASRMNGRDFRQALARELIVSAALLPDRPDQFFPHATT